MSSNSFIFFTSDHGNRYDPIRKTFRGYFEDSLPFLYVRIPEIFKLKHPNWIENFQKNSYRLTSPIDGHSTLEHILSEIIKFPIYKNQNFIKNFQRKSKYFSLFEEIPLNRTCKDAGIGTKWCRCGIFEKIGHNLEISKKLQKSATDLLIKMINSFIKNEIKMRKCSSLQLKQIDSVTKLSENNENLIFLLKFHVKPSNGLFEGKIQYYKKGNSKKKMKIIENDIERINSYKNQSFCVNSEFLKNYCYCI